LVVALQITIYSDDVQCSVKRKFGLDELKIFYKQKPFLSQPHFEASVRMRLALPKVGTWSPLGLPKLQSSIARVKTPLLHVFFIPLERSWSVDVKMVLHEPLEHLQHKLWSKEGSGVKLAIWLPTTKSRELTQPRCVQVECDTPLESSWEELQVCFRPHPNQRSEMGVMSSQSPRSPN
jgi:hypothetical protein